MATAQKTAKKRLGRGLGNLIASGAPPVSSPSPTNGTAHAAAPVSPKAPPAEAGPYREVDVASIVPNPFQPRKSIDDDRIQELADSIASEGLLQPIVVRKKPNGFELIAGERRWRAHQKLGLPKIMARVMDANDASTAVIALIENLQREGLNPIEEALGYASLMRDFELTQESVAERVGRGRASVANALRLLQLDREIQGYLAKGMISVGHAKVLLGVEDEAQRLVLCRRVIENSLSVRETEVHVKRLRSETGPRPSGESVQEAEQTVIRDLEKNLSSQLNTKVQLKHNAKKGRLVIEYYGNDDLQRILERTGLG